jgi:thiol:disulfide interchange protein DsbD
VRARKAAGVTLAVIGLFGATNYVLTPKGATELTWLTDEPSAVAVARAAQRPLLVDFRANWCLPCKEFEVKVFSRPEVAEALQRYTLLRVDLTHEDDEPMLGAVKKKYAADTLPAIRLVGPDGALLAKTDEFMEAEAFLKLLQPRL